MQVIKLTSDGKMEHFQFYGFYRKISFKGTEKIIEMVALIAAENFARIVKPEELLFNEELILRNL